MSMGGDKLLRAMSVPGVGDHGPQNQLFLVAMLHSFHTTLTIIFIHWRPLHPFHLLPDVLTFSFSHCALYICPNFDNHLSFIVDCPKDFFSFLSIKLSSFFLKNTFQ